MVGISPLVLGAFKAQNKNAAQAAMQATAEQ